MAKVPLGQNITRSLARFRNPSIRDLARQYARVARLLLPIPVDPRPAPARPERIVVTLSTIPARAHRLRPTLRSLLHQSEPADRIVLCLPHRSRRSGKAYPEPENLGLPPGIEVLRCTDEGPATKLLPVLKREREARIIVVDDDVIYPHDFIATLLAAHRRAPDHALGMRGVRLADGVAFPALAHVMCSGIAAPQLVDVLFGTWGYLLPPGALDAGVHDFSGFDEAVRWVDDVWVCGHLARLGVPRAVVPANSFPVETRASFVQALTDGPNRSGENDAAAIAAFSPYWNGPGGGV